MVNGRLAPVYIQSAMVAEKVIDGLIDKTMSVCQDKEIAFKIKPFSLVYTRDLC